MKKAHQKETKTITKPSVSRQHSSTSSFTSNIGEEVMTPPTQVPTAKPLSTSFNVDNLLQPTHSYNPDHLTQHNLHFSALAAHFKFPYLGMSMPAAGFEFLQSQLIASQHFAQRYGLAQQSTQRPMEHCHQETMDSQNNMDSEETPLNITDD